MNVIEDFCILLGMPALVVFLIVCFHYEWIKFMLGVLVVLGISIPLYYSLSKYEIKEEADGIHVFRKCDFRHSHEQVGDSISTLKICNMINKYEDEFYQPRTIIYVLFLKNGNVVVYSKRKCLIHMSPFVNICKFEDSSGYVVDLLQYVDQFGDTLYYDTYNYKIVEPESFRIPSHYIDPTVYLY